MRSVAVWSGGAAEPGTTSRLSVLTAGAAAASVVVMGLVMLWLVHLNGAGLTDQVGFMLPFLTFAPIAGLLAARRPANPIGWILLAIPASAVLYALGQQYVLAWPARGVALLEVDEAYAASDAVFAAVFPVLLVGAVAAWASLAARYRGGGSVERLQIRWLAFGLAAFIAGLLGSTALPDHLVSRLLPGLIVPLVPGAIALAVLRHRLYEIDRIISRTVVYTIVTVLLAGTYVSLVVILQAGLRPFTSGSDFAVAASTLAVAAAFGPLRRRVQSLVDRRFDRSRYDAQRTVETFSHHVRDEVDLEVLRGELTAVTDETMHPRTVQLWAAPVRGAGAP